MLIDPKFRGMAIERLKNCDNILALSRELGLHRRLLYKWRDQLKLVDVRKESLRAQKVNVPKRKITSAE